MQRNKLENWLVQKLQNSVPVSADKLRIGNSQLSCYCQSADPLRIFLEDDTNRIHNLKFKLDTESKNLEFVYSKRLLKTPFIVHYVVWNDQPVKIIDFFQWTSSPAIYRLLLLPENTDLETILICPESESDFSRQFQLNASCPIVKSAGHYRIKPSNNDNGIIRAVMGNTNLTEADNVSAFVITDTSIKPMK